MKTLQNVEKLRNKELQKREKSLTFRPNIDKNSEVMALSNRKGD